MKLYDPTSLANFKFSKCNTNFDKPTGNLIIYMYPPPLKIMNMRQEKLGKLLSSFWLNLSWFYLNFLFFFFNQFGFLRYLVNMITNTSSGELHFAFKIEEVC